MQIYFIHDFLRAEWDGGTAERNGRWLHVLLAPALRRLGHQTTRIGLTHPAVQTFLARTLGASRGDIAPRWPAFFSDPDAAFHHVILLPPLAGAGLVIGLELSPNQMRVLHAAEIPFADVAIDPVRFGPDLFLAVRTNHPELAHALTGYAAPSAPIIQEARRLCTLSRNGLPRQTLFVGQTDMDAALITDARLGSVGPHLCALRQRFGNGEHVLIKPHLYGRTHRDVHTLHQAFPKARLTNDNVYTLLGSGTVAKVVTLSSGVATEAPFFGVPATTLLQPDTARIEFVSPRIRLSPESLGPDLWATTSRSIAGLPRQKASLRARLGLAWAYPPPPHLRDRRVKVNDSFDFSRDSQRDLRGFGWSYPEPTGCWTDGPLATLLVDPAGRQLDLAIHCRAFLPIGAEALQVDLEVRGSSILPKRLTFRRHRPSTIIVTLPVEGPVEVVLRIVNSRSPASAGVSNDRRALGLHVTTISVRSQRAAATALVPNLARAIAASIAAALIGG